VDFAYFQAADLSFDERAAALFRMLATTPGQPQSLRGMLRLSAFLKFQKAVAGSTGADQRNLVRRAWMAVVAEGHGQSPGPASSSQEQPAGVAAAAEESDVFGRLFLGRQSSEKQKASASTPMLAFTGFLRFLELLEEVSAAIDSEDAQHPSAALGKQHVGGAGIANGKPGTFGSAITGATTSTAPVSPGHGGFTEVTDDESDNDAVDGARRDKASKVIPKQGFIMVESADSQPPPVPSKPLSTQSLLPPAESRGKAAPKQAKAKNRSSNDIENDDDVFGKLILGKVDKAPLSEKELAAARAAAPMPPGATKKKAVARPLRVGDAVTWQGADADVPRGSVGVVERVHRDGDVEVSFVHPRFYGGYGGLGEEEEGSGRVCFTFHADRLQLEGKEPATVLGAVLSGLLD